MLELLMGKWKETAAFCLTLLVGQTPAVAVRAAALRMQFRPAQRFAHRHGLCTAS